MNRALLLSLPFLALTLSASAAPSVPDNLKVEGVPAFPPELKADAGRYLEFRAAAFQGWHPGRREMLITTRFADTPQLHLLKMPGGARRQLTFSAEPVSGGGYRPKTGECIIFSQDSGGGEAFQLYRYDVADGRISLLTDGKSRNTGAKWSHDGRLLAFTSTARNGTDNDVWVLDPDKPAERRMVCEVQGGGWGVSDWSHDGSKFLLTEFLSANESKLWLADAKTGKRERLTPEKENPVSREGATFSKDDSEIFLTTDEGGEFKQLVRMNPADKKSTVLTKDIPWDVESLALSPDGEKIAFTTNEDGSSVLHIIAAGASAGKATPVPPLPKGVITGLEWREDGSELGFSMTGARSPADAYSLDASGKLERWTESETGGLDASTFVEPELVKVKSFDGVTVSGFLYVPDARKFPGKRPVLINIHGGPEGQSRPVFQARNNYYLNELGVAILYPNVRGSDGYGKTFLAMDNGFKREESVKDISTFLDFIAKHERLDASRAAVIGGSYGGYMVLACMTHYNDRLRCGCDIVGISNFLTFLANTSGYRRDLRRVEYGDERDPKMKAFLDEISPMTSAAKIKKPLFIVQGKNDPRVPLSEAEQMVKAVRDGGTPVWYLMAADEGHGFAKKKNSDFMFLSTILFFREHLLGAK
ncbi:MAG TPA: S9 family peptidase [Verrucomicrobiales bacterium]|jgi:dipeptidyl aminopeptidase/acylaminoacyl peptidase|nr:S9 family peptidase [Verrucomicrobiales bacterium]